MATTHKQIVGKYELGKVLAAGYFDSRTRICTHIVTGAQYVVRIYSKDVLAEAQWMWDRTRNAIQVMRTMPKNENIIETVECFETESSLYLLMQMFAPMHMTKLYTSENASGKRIMVPLQKTKNYYAQVVRGLMHMHKHGVVHLGIAPDHVMVSDRDVVKIGYLVSCTYFPRGKLSRELRGTTHTVAPEILRNDAYDPYVADAWSMGVLLYFMLHQGRYPHDGANTMKNILYNRLRPPDPFLSPAAKNLLGQLLQPVPARRMRVEQILEHPFFFEEQLESNARRSSSSFRSHVHSYNMDNVTDTVNINVPYGLSRKEEAAYIIQHTYRAYLQRKRSNEERNRVLLFSAPQENNISTTSQNVSHSDSAARLKDGTPMENSNFTPFGRRLRTTKAISNSFMVNSSALRPSFFDENHPPHSLVDSETPEALTGATDMDELGDAKGFPGKGLLRHRHESEPSKERFEPTMEMPQFDDPIHPEEAGSEDAFEGSLSLPHESSVIILSDTLDAEDRVDSNTATWATSHPVGAAERANPSRRHAARSGGPPHPHRAADRKSTAVNGTAGVNNSTAHHAGRLMGPLPGGLMDHEGRSAATDTPNAHTAMLMAHVKVDATRACPVCKRLPTQRLGGRAPYAQTPYVFANGEFLLKESQEEES